MAVSEMRIKSILLIKSDQIRFKMVNKYQYMFIVAEVPYFNYLVSDTASGPFT